MGGLQGGIRHQIGAPWKGAPQEIRSDYLQKPLPTGKISGQARSDKERAPQRAPIETSNQSLDPVGHTSVHLQACPTTQVCSLAQPSGCTLSSFETGSRGTSLRQLEERVERPRSFQEQGHKSDHRLSTPLWESLIQQSRSPSD